MRMPPLLADIIHARACIPICEKFLTLPIWLSRPRNGSKMARIEKAGLLPRFFLDIIEINLLISQLLY